MIKAEKGSIQMTGSARDILFEFGTIVASISDEFGQDAMIDAVASALVILSNKFNKVDLSNLRDALRNLNGEEER